MFQISFLWWFHSLGAVLGSLFSLDFASMSLASDASGSDYQMNIPG
jgi:hypothetical protein